MNSKLAQTLSNVFEIPVSQITLELTRDSIGNWDSLRQMDLVISLERDFSISLEIPEIIKMKSVASIVEILISKGVLLED